MNFNVQREIGFGTLLEVAYINTRGFYLHRNDESGLSLNQLDPSLMALGSKLNEQVDNPFYGKFSGGVLSQPRTEPRAASPTLSAVHQYHSNLFGGRFVVLSFAAGEREQALKQRAPNANSPIHGARVWTMA